KSSHGMITEKEETRKTIVFCPESTVKNLVEKYPNYRNNVSDYNWTSFPTPVDTQGETWNLHISGVPNDYTVTDAMKYISESLNCILPHKNEEGKDNYYINFAPRLRETGEIHGFGQ